ncbi:hypothetical protein Bca4012_031629 [Brassica carinata]
MASASSNPESRFSTKTSFEILDECFNGLVTAIRLLKLKGSLTSIANICPKIEYLTNLIFSYDHLAQMKHIYPEAIEVKRVLKCDEVTSYTSCGTKYMQLRTVFYSKLVDFYKAHPKDEIPKELLPEPFNFSKKDSDTIRSVNTNQAHECYTALQPSRRCLTMTPDDDSDSVRPTNDLERRPSRTRCLNFDTLEEEDGTVSDESNDEANDDEASDASYDEDSDASYDEISLLHSEEPKAETVKQNLPKLVDVIHKLFRSTNKTVITKEELLHKMIACQIDIMDRSSQLLSCFVFLSEEVEEQLRLMLQLVPDWISETKASFGDVLVSINKMSNPDTVRARLEEATSQDTSTTPDK